MKKLLVLLLILTASQDIFGQSGWMKYSIEPSMPLQTFFFVNEQTGYAASVNHFYNFTKTTNGGVNWDVISWGGQWDETNGLYFFDELTGLRTLSYTLQKTTNGGVIWFNISIQNTFPYDLKFINNSTGFCSGNGINKTTDGGNNWFVSVPFDTMKFFMDFEFINANTGYVSGTFRDSVGILYKTTDSGVTWNKLNSSMRGEYFYSLSFSNALTGYILADSNNYPAYLYKTTDGGITWQQKASEFLSDRLIKISVIDNNIAFALGRNRLLKTTNGGENFFPIYQPVSSNGYLSGIYFRNSFTGFVSGVDSAKAFVAKTVTGGVNVRQISSAIPDNFSLSQNYPNPFNPNTVISYRLSVAGNVSLKVFDLLGKEVAVLVNEKQSAGSYAVDFNSTEYNLTSGIYFYTLSAGEFKETKKMVLVR